MRDGETITIRKVHNGFIVEPERPAHIMADIPAILVFNEMGYASSPGDSVALPCLLKFIEQHFADGGSAPVSRK